MFVYKITNTVTNKEYVGQTIQSSERRWIEHRRDLRGNRHFNPYLQNAWNKYGEKVWKFSVLKEVSSLTELNKLETKLIRKFNTLVPNGYNLTDGGLNSTHNKESKKKISRSLKRLNRKDTLDTLKKRSKSRRPQGYPIVQSPNGERFKIEVMNIFCREHGLEYTGMYKLVDGKTRQYKGWRIKGTNLSESTGDLIARNHRPRGYPDIKSPRGKIYKGILNLSQFCKKHNLCNSNLNAVVNGKAKSHKGWTLA